ncbi:ubiquinol oxidase subunit II [Budvicia aquatica]|uniref:Ubiquinol oxidase subunit 2 n=1 Tax=Budvicia aquatica TaxID=82979 RepID=A0A2C6C7Q2_9GAMM|nr:ubiquinol oxidase subunit II [Budvicia aquatica]MBP9642856.1 ubiquinol oxidase subunit II [Budvicia sp.]PHI32360.1 ubiquinol oxidase subunit II [Budvicia aquatica]GKX53854.1 ubiquinol oxidase subunit 2 [Budvicia aquatica]VFS45340.1 Ubiquinol oxidase subunit 2 precursor [Budvicia aquatica]
MSLKQYNKFSKLLILAIVGLLLSGCDMALMNPKGQIGMEQRTLILTATFLMLIVVIPVIFMTFYFAWKYRESNKNAKYTPNWAHSNKIEMVVWGIPCIIIIILGVLTWKSTQELDPRQPIQSDAKTITVEAIAMNWKWLFIYPELGIATVNEISFPENVPVKFKVTSDDVMNSFFIPRLGSQIYAMAGMQNIVHLIANEKGVYPGMSANYSGAGFSGMKFNAIVTSQEDFEKWVEKVRQSPDQLQWEDYKQLAKPSENNPVQFFSTVKPGLYLEIINQYMGMDMSKHSHSGAEE